MHLFLELFTVAAFVAAAVHARWRWGVEGVWLFGSMLWLGLVRENFVVVRELLYGFAPLTLEVGRAPLIAAVIWGFSIWAAVVWAEAVGPPRVISARGLALVAVFMVGLAWFYEPLLGRVGMARWEAGTRATLGVPWIAMVGYPTLALPFLALYVSVSGRICRPGPRAAVLAVAIGALGVAHAWGLQTLKRLLGW
jgi:hypothetical protein